jgi:hypothetical protein
VGFYPQPDDWSCGPFALKHALAAIGHVADEQDLARIAKTHWWSGTDEIRLARAARAYDCDLEYVRTLNAERARKELTASLRERCPALLCVDDWGHWITALACERGEFVVVDSLADPVLAITTWTRLRKRWVYFDTDYDKDDPPAIYDFFAVTPSSRVPVRANLTPARVRHLRRAQNRALAEHWDEYLEDLLAICRPRSQLMQHPLSMAEFLRRHQDLIVSRALYWHGDASPTAVSQLMANFRFVAETYGLVVPAAHSRRAITDLSILTALWIAGTRGIGPLYGTGG